ncbi:MAG: hypothetical protein A2W91_19390 [Bacteroidetes bacterium GWF2_38_335]|nr:MAG: hypothetical protein A2W91_19390 [Bacteroidetes bacterium GWF2_38_335]OFY79923.1 MAG: hypothetical protein A2281_10790 [Bacteroidetes bacterium RIFOXYA12_FULL_38_20]HBS86380.1 hypothetical protein [Bacteroidales bacterium]
MYQLFTKTNQKIEKMKKFGLFLVAVAVMSFVAFTSCDKKKEEKKDEKKAGDTEQVEETTPVEDEAPVEEPVEEVPAEEAAE